MKLRLLLIVLMLAGVSILMAQERQPGMPPRPGMGRPVAVLVAGQAAPDFELPRLKLVKENGKTVGKVGPETVKLSSFQGKRPVLLVLSSYT